MSFARSGRVQNNKVTEPESVVVKIDTYRLESLRKTEHQLKKLLPLLLELANLCSSNHVIRWHRRRPKGLVPCYCTPGKIRDILMEEKMI